MMPTPRKPRVNAPQDRIPRDGDAPALETPGRFVVQLPGGGELTLSTADEVVMWNETMDRYVKDYRITRQNDLILLGALLANILMMYRAQRDLADPKKMAGAQEKISKSSEEIRKAEKALGIDKATREKGGQHTVADYITLLKRAAHVKGVRLSERLVEHERVAMEARWKIRVLRNADKDDADYHRLSDRAIVDWLEQELAKIEEADKEWAKTKFSVFVGKL